jgi:hypothetical protein
MYPPAWIHSHFHCPLCHVYADQRFSPVYSKLIFSSAGGSGEVPNLAMSLCSHCNMYCVWIGKQLIYPDNTGIQPANEDLREDIISDYNEAASIVQKSPRGAAALLRLAIQKLCAALGEKGKRIDADIASLVKKGLPVQIQQALDIVRVIGNESVHPGTIDLRDDPETAIQLFNLVNIIAEVMVTQPKRIAAMYVALPADKLKGIEDRGKKF